MSDLPPPPESTPPPPPPPPFGSPPPPPPFSAPPPPGYVPYGAAPPVEYATFGPRLGGWVIDQLIMSSFFIPAVVALVAGPTELETCTVDASGNVTSDGQFTALCEQPTSGTVAVAVLLGIVAVVGAFVYQAKLLGGPRGATVGMKTAGVRAVDATTGGPIGPGRAIGRFLFAGIVSGAIFYLGYLWMLWDGRKQTWQDKVVSSVVVKG